MAQEYASIQNRDFYSHDFFLPKMHLASTVAKSIAFTIVSYHFQFGCVVCWQGNFHFFSSQLLTCVTVNSIRIQRAFTILYSRCYMTFFVPEKNIPSIVPPFSYLLSLVSLVRLCSRPFTDRYENLPYCRQTYLSCFLA